MGRRTGNALARLNGTFSQGITGGKFMRVISVILSDREIARIDEEGNFKQLVEFKGLVQPSVRQLYDDCFYGVPNSSTFDERFELVESHSYFCWTKPALQLAARILP